MLDESKPGTVSAWVEWLLGLPEDKAEAALRNLVETYEPLADELLVRYGIALSQSKGRASSRSPGIDALVAAERLSVKVVVERNGVQVSGGVRTLSLEYDPATMMPGNPSIAKALTPVTANAAAAISREYRLRPLGRHMDPKEVAAPPGEMESILDALGATGPPGPPPLRTLYAVANGNAERYTSVVVAVDGVDPRDREQVSGGRARAAEIAGPYLFAGPDDVLDVCPLVDPPAHCNLPLSGEKR